jgi:mannose-6-phosphate isomerase
MAPPREASVTADDLYPLRFEPMFQYRLWGGRDLGEFMNTVLPGDDPIGEAWILSDRAEFASKIENGALAGKTLTDLMRTRKSDVLGRQAARFDRFPLLLKFLDVEKMLSVQVHPRDDQTDLIPAGDTGKTEAWVVLRTKPEGRIYAGLKPGTTPRDLRALTADNADAHLASFQPEAGQGVMIQAGTVHSLGDGVMVFEVQENSDVTFRLFDWGHVDAKTGKPRPLQVDQALASVDFDQGAILPVQPEVENAQPVRGERVFHNTHFDLKRWQGSQPFDVGAPGEARVLVCVDGAGRVKGAAEDVEMVRGDAVLLPAVVGAGHFIPDGAVILLEIAVGNPA